MRTYAAEIIKLEDEEVELYGWVSSRRDHGKLVFIDLRDRSGLAQIVLGPEIKEAGDLRLEYVVKIEGAVKKRPEAMINDKIPTGRYEVQAKELEIISRAEALPISIDTDGYEINEEMRMKYRYLDLRRERMQKNLVCRHKIAKFIRDFLDKEGFSEIETPILTKSTPEGARDYLVPSRLWSGKFYALPQSPQQYKQLLMVAGLEKYFQIARCFRDEDTRGDRQPEFTQLDLEMSFVEQEDVMGLNEELLTALVKAVAPEKKLLPFRRLSYAEAMKKYNTDRPDLREDKNDPNLLAFCWITDFPFFEPAAGGERFIYEELRPGVLKQKKGKWTFTHNPFSAPKKGHNEKGMDYGDMLLKAAEGGYEELIPKILTSQYDLVLNGWEIGGGSIRAHRPYILKAVFKVIGYSDNEIEEKFGHMLEALSYGAPPHGGIAWGLDRLVSILQNEPNIREAIAFPKTGEGFDPMMGSPSEVDKKQLDELGLEIKRSEKS